MQVCDRCKKEIKDITDKKAEVIFYKWEPCPDIPHCVYDTTRKYLLCKNCAKELKEFMGIQTIFSKTMKLVKQLIAREG